MRLVTFQGDHGPTLGALVPGGVLDFSRIEGMPRDIHALIDGGEPFAEWVETRVHHAARGGNGVLALESVRLSAPIPRPRKNVMLLGLNYVEHIEQNARRWGTPVVLPEHPLFFSKPPTAVIGPDADILLDLTLTHQLDYEVELAVVIGRGGTYIAPENALAHVFGYTIVNDVSARDLQTRVSQFFYGKGLDTFCPMGPCIVTRSELGAAGALALRLRVNGELRQNNTTANMIWSVAATIAALSAGLTLEAGDVISLGTPGGCGYAMSPPRYLQPGDVIEAEIESIGVLRNAVRHRTPAERGTASAGRDQTLQGTPA